MCNYIDKSIKFKENVGYSNYHGQDYFPCFNYFSINMDIPNIIIISNDCGLNIKIIESTITKLKIKDLESKRKKHILENYLKGGCNHPSNNYYLAVYIYELNEIQENIKINGWINIVDSDEIFILRPIEFLNLTQYKNIYKITNNYGNIYENKAYLNSSVNGATFHVGVYNNKHQFIKNEIFKDFENSSIANILPTLCNISNGYYIDIKNI